MNAIPNAAALGLGCLIGLLVYGPVKRWLLTLRRTLRERAAHEEQARASSGALLLIFATLHPAPWVLLLGLPYALYRLWLDPLRAMWSFLLAGAVLACVLLALFAAYAGGAGTRRRTRSTVRA